MGECTWLGWQQPASGAREDGLGPAQGCGAPTKGRVPLGVQCLPRMVIKSKDHTLLCERGVWTPTHTCVHTLGIVRYRDTASRMLHLLKSNGREANSGPAQSILKGRGSTEDRSWARLLGVLTLESCKYFTKPENKTKYKESNLWKLENHPKQMEPNCNCDWWHNYTEKNYFKWLENTLFLQPRWVRA